MTLAELAVGDSAQVASIHGVDGVAVRLLEMGLTPGATLQVIGVAPLGDPFEIELRGYRLSLRRSEAERVELK